MEGIKVEDIDYTNHEIKCRICFKSFGIAEHRVEISKLIEKKFYDVTQTKLKLSEKYSSEICVICSYQLTNYSLFKKHVILSQAKLYMFSRENQKRFKKLDQALDQVHEVFIKEEFDIEMNMKYDAEESHMCNVSYSDTLELELNPDILNEGLVLENYLKNVVRRQQSGKIGENKCPHCDIRVVERSQLKRHIERVHLKIKNFMCDQCSYECYFKHALKSHMKSHVDRETRRQFSCKKCLYVTVSENSLRSHDRSQHLKSLKQVFECTACFKSFRCYNQLYRHKQKMHEEIEKYVCNICNKSLTGASALKNHTMLFHSNKAPSISCPMSGCPKVCITLKQMRNHIKTHDDDTKEICPECGLLVANKHTLEKHINRVHLKVRNFACDLCEYKGFFKFNIVDHMKKHLDISEREKHRCGENGCTFESVSKTSLHTHKRIEHMGQKKTFICHCGKIFTQNSSLKAHVIMVHEKLKKHSCKICPKAFFEKSQLRNHIKSQHLKLRDLPCEVCQKMFSTKRHLQSHMKYHDEPQYVCTITDCTNAFYTLAQLTSHINVHNNQRDHKCHVISCSKSYFHKSHLKKHLLTHGIS